STKSVSVAALVPAVGALFPVIKGAAKVGDMWADTVKKDTSMASMGGADAKGTVNTITTTKLSAQNAAGFAIEGTTTGTMSAAMPGMGQMDMKLSGTSHIVSPARGPAHDGTVQNTGTGTMNAMGAAIPVTNKNSIVITALP